MPLSTPKPPIIEGKHDVYYMPLEETVKQPFTDMHQLSLINRMQNANVVAGEVSIGERESRSSYGVG
jgi:hypothetical protein